MQARARSLVPLVAQRWLARGRIRTAASTAVEPASVAVPVWTSDCFLPVCAAEQLFLSMHAALPWWAAIGSTALVLRTTFTLPVSIWQARMRSRMLALAPHMRSLAVAIRSAIQQSGKYSSEREAQAAALVEFRQSVKRLHQEHRIRPILSMVVGPAIQLPIFASAFYALRGFAGRNMSAAVPDFATGGFWIFTDLTRVDETWVLPFLCAAVYLLNVELNIRAGRRQAAAAAVQPGLLSRIAALFQRLFAVAMLPIGTYMPVGFEMYWLASGLYSVAQTLLMQRPAVKRWIGAPDPDPVIAENRPPPLPSSPPSSSAAASATDATPSDRLADPATAAAAVAALGSARRASFASVSSERGRSGKKGQSRDRGVEWQ